MAGAHYAMARAASLTATAASAGRRSALTTAGWRPVRWQGRRQYASSSSAAAAEDEQPLRRTGLHDLHVAHGGKMVPFAGFSMPVQYADLSVSASHHWTRTKASLFDVGHMVQRHIEGPGAIALLETLTPSSVAALAHHRSTLSVLLSGEQTGGIVDDAIISRLGAELFYIVTNAGCRAKDDAYFARWLADDALRRQLPGPVSHRELAGWGLVALQGPLSAEILQEVLVADGEDLSRLVFGASRYGRLRLTPGSDSAAEQSTPLLISRGGYTGEDGFEISIPPAETVAVTEALLAAGTPERLRLAGLGARDSLRLEAGMCLYGHDIDESTTPVEAALSWLIPKARRRGEQEAGRSVFFGAETIYDQLTPKAKGGQGVSRRRVGLIVEGAPAREGAEIISTASGSSVGRVTSGCPSPTLGQNIAMGYVREGLHKVGTELGVVVRGKTRRAVVTKMPFVPTHYWKGK